MTSYYVHLPPMAYDSDASLSSTSSDEDDLNQHAGPAGDWAESAGAPSESQPPPQPTPPPVETVTCMWDNCGRQFSDLQPLITHVHDDHVGVHKSVYTCEWAGCPRRGLSQTSRFALVSHIRSHTGEKPFTCSLPECDKSFTRSDALAKHMRLQHGISPPAPGRGNRKRKRGGETSLPVPDMPGLPSLQGLETIAPGTSIIKAEPGDDGDYRASIEAGSSIGAAYNDSATQVAMSGQTPPNDGGGEEESNFLFDLPESLMRKYDTNTATVLGRSVPMVMYLLEKAKCRYALSEHELLLDELETLRHEEMRLRESKDAVMDRVLQRELGPEQASVLMGPIIIPPHPEPAKVVQPPLVGLEKLLVNKPRAARKGVKNNTKAPNSFQTDVASV